jgi:spore germination cell wall hydrolase CwlJ-like protein
MFRKASFVAAAAAIFLAVFSAEGSGAYAQQSKSLTVPETPVTAETVPVFVSHEVVQPLPGERAPKSAATDEGTPDAASLRELVAKMPRADTLSDEMECLAGAVYFESRGEPLAGQLAVAEVIINRAESGSFPSDYCGVVFQRSQFSFVRGGKMPRINRSSAAWARATAIARIAHKDLWDGPADDALYFHAKYVHPGWSRTKVALATIDSHIFYR